MKAPDLALKEPVLPENIHPATALLVFLPMIAVLMNIREGAFDDSTFFFLGISMTIISAIAPIIVMRRNKAGGFRSFQKDSGITLSVLHSPFLCGIALALLANAMTWSTLGSPHTRIGYVLVVGIVAAIVLVLWMAISAIPPRVALTEFDVRVFSVTDPNPLLGMNVRHQSYPSTVP